MTDVDIFDIPHHTIVAGYYGFTLNVCVPVHPSYVHPFVLPSILILFPDDDLSKHQWIFTKLGMCIDIVEIWFGIANGQILMDYVICPRQAHVVSSFKGTRNHY